MFWHDNGWKCWWKTVTNNIVGISQWDSNNSISQHIYQQYYCFPLIISKWDYHNGIYNIVDIFERSWSCLILVSHVFLMTNLRLGFNQRPTTNEKLSEIIPKLFGYIIAVYHRYMHDRTHLMSIGHLIIRSHKEKAAPIDAVPFHLIYNMDIQRNSNQ